MAKKLSTRSLLINEINEVSRHMSTWTVLFHQAIAEKVGLAGVDHKYLDVLVREGPMTAGKFATLTRLTTGAITGLLDRLEKEGLVIREKDPKDRRKVIVLPQVPAIKKRMAPVFNVLIEDMHKWYERFSIAELQVIKRYQEEIISFMMKKTESFKTKERLDDI